MRAVLKPASEAELAAIGRAFILPPGTNPAAVKALQTGFMEMVKDPEFLADIRKSNIDFDGPSDGASVEAMVKALYATPKPVVDRVTELRNRVD